MRQVNWLAFKVTLRSPSFPSRFQSPTGSSLNESMPNHTPILEACVETLTEAIQAAEAGASRLDGLRQRLNTCLEDRRVIRHRFVQGRSGGRLESGGE